MNNQHPFWHFASFDTKQTGPTLWFIFNVSHKTIQKTNKESYHNLQSILRENILSFGIVVIGFHPLSDCLLPGETGHGRIAVGDDVLSRIHSRWHHPVLQPSSLDLKTFFIICCTCFRWDRKCLVFNLVKLFSIHSFKLWAQRVILVQRDTSCK